MLWTNYHTHCDYCDGRGAAHQYLLQAKQRGLAAIGFSSHAPVPFDNDFAIRDSQLKDYLKTIRQLQAAAITTNGPEVYVGLEIDFLPGICTPSDEKWQACKLDYKIGSVHALRGPTSDHPMLAVDGHLDDFRYLWQEIYHQDTRAMVTDYFALIAELCQQGGFNILGHYDLIKKNNRVMNFLDESAGWYRECALDTLDAVAQAGVVLEVNTGGIARGAIKEIYPAPWILKQAFIKNIPIQLNADAHYPEHVDFHFRESLTIMREAGYRSVRVLLENVWQDIAID